MGRVGWGVGVSLVFETKKRPGTGRPIYGVSYKIYGSNGWYPGRFSVSKTRETPTPQPTRPIYRWKALVQGYNLMFILAMLGQAGSFDSGLEVCKNFAVLEIGLKYSRL